LLLHYTAKIDTEHFAARLSIGFVVPCVKQMLASHVSSI